MKLWGAHKEKEKKPLKYTLKMNFLPLTFLLYILFVVIFAVATMGLDLRISFGLGESGADIQSILARYNTVGPFYCEGTMSVSGGFSQQEMSGTLKYWQELPYYKMEATASGATTQMIGRPDGVYVYNTEEGKYEKMPDASQSSQQGIADIVEQMKGIQGLQVLGKDTINGKASTVVQYSTSALGITVVQKVWLWDAKGLPLKIMITMDMGDNDMITTMTFSSYSFGDVPDSVFDISA